ncbi:MAG: toxin-antitoxin system HicB family antitoxin [Schwartzia sp.]|nr:toxin-antitoxin system HicB family antitoxin [Schwartzia sp. (in: firmicutes)]
MFHVQRTEMISKTFRLPEELVSRLSTVAQQQGVSMNNLVAQCCSYALDHLANPDGKEDAKTNS